MMALRVADGGVKLHSKTLREREREREREGNIPAQAA